MGKKLDISDQLRRAIQAELKTEGESLFTIAVHTGVNQAVLSRFLTGKRDIRLATAAAIAAHLGLQLTKPK